MPATRPLLADLREELAALGGDLREMAGARWELARLELQADARSLGRLAVAWIGAAVLALTALPLLIVCLADGLNRWTPIGQCGWLAILAGSFLLLAAAIACLAWRRFRRRFLGLRETLEELREDLLWLQEIGSRTSERE
jgi:uncharacterized membrane protein YqjE